MTDKATPPVSGTGAGVVLSAISAGRRRRQQAEQETAGMKRLVFQKKAAHDDKTPRTVDGAAASQSECHLEIDRWRNLQYYVIRPYDLLVEESRYVLKLKASGLRKCAHKPLTKWATALPL